MKPVYYALMVCFAAQSRAEDLSLSWGWALSAQSDRNQSSLFVPDVQSRSNSVNGIFDLEAQYRSWTGLASVSTENLYSNEGDIEADAILQELFTQGSFQLSDLSLDYQLGKVRLDWGVGYGYSPLNLFGQYSENSVGLEVEEGIGAASVSSFDMSGEWTLFAVESSWVSQQTSELEQAREHQGLGIKRYWLSANNEYQLVAYYDNIREGLVGASWVTVLNPAWEVHGSAVLQNRYIGYGIPDSSTEAVSLDTRSRAFQGMIGATWASVAGVQVIVEYWYDSRSWSDEDWSLASNRVSYLSDYTYYDDLRYSYAQGYDQTNLIDHNLMLHWQVDGSAVASMGSFSWMQDFTPKTDLLYSPSDGGLIATQTLNYQIADTGRYSVEIDLASRYFTGASSSLYANLPSQHRVWLNLVGKF